MPTGRTLPELAYELRRQAALKHDFLAPAQELAVSKNGRTCLHVAGGMYDLTAIGHSHLAEYVGVPKPFYDRLLTLDEPGEDDDDAHEPLYDVVVNRLLRARGADRRLVRVLDGTARAVLSESFSIDLDNYDVFRVAAKAIEQAGLGPEHVVSAEVTERRLYLKVVSPKLEAVIEPSNLTRPHGVHHYLKEPQVVQAGFLITNSEVGLGALAVQQTVYKLMCTNMWVVEEAYRQRHIGRALEAEPDGRVYRSDTRLADAEARLLKLRDHIGDVLDETRFRSMVARMQASTEVRLTGGVEKIVTQTAVRFGLTTQEKDDVLASLIEGADLTLWGLSNAVTAAAHTSESYDRATELEALGGRLLALPDREVRELAQTA